MALSLVLVGIALIGARPAHADSTYWVDVCADGNQAGVLAPLTAGVSNAKMSENCGSGSTNTLSVVVDNDGTTTTTPAPTSTTDTPTPVTTYNDTAEAGEQNQWVVYAPAGESLVGLSATNATYNNPTLQNGYGPGVYWDQAFVGLAGGVWTYPAGQAQGSNAVSLTFPGQTAMAWGTSCSWTPASTSTCNDDGTVSTVTNWKLEVDDPDTGAGVGATPGSSLVNDENHWISGNSANGASITWNFADPGGICATSLYLYSQYAQDGTSVGQQMDASSQTYAPFNSSDGDFNQTTCTGPATATYTPTLTSLPTGAYGVYGTAANPSQYAAGTQTTLTEGILFIDNNTPTLSFSGATFKAWYPSATTVSVNSSDGSEAQGQNSGIQSTTCTDADNQTWTNAMAAGGYEGTQSVPVTLSAAGIHELFCTATNGAGTSSPSESFILGIDPQTPTLKMTKVTAAPKLLRKPPTFIASGAEKVRLSGVTTSCVAHNATTGDRLSTKATAKIRLTLTSGGKWTVTCTARTAAGLSVSHTERVDLARQPLDIKLSLGYRYKTKFTYIKSIKFPPTPTGTRWTFLLRTPRGRTLKKTARGGAAVAALITAIEKTPYESGDRLTITLSRKGYLTETGVLAIHLHRPPTPVG